MFMNKYIECLLILIVSLIIIKLIKKIFSKINKRKQIHISFLKSLLQITTVIIATFLIGSHFDTFRNISASLITGSTLIVAVLAFSLEEGISNIIHGLIISIFKPFDIGDRLTLVEKGITGTVENITARHTVIKNCVTGTSVIIPNAVMNKEIIENSYFQKTIHTHYVDISIDRDNDLEEAMGIFKNIVINDPRYVGDDNLKIYIRDISDNAIYLRAFIPTKTLEDNFDACSDIRKNLINEFNKKGIKQPYLYVIPQKE